MPDMNQQGEEIECRHRNPIPSHCPDCERDARVQANVHEQLSEKTEELQEKLEGKPPAESRAASPPSLASAMCSVCAGMGHPISQRPCICGGDGKAESEAQGLRKRVLALETALEPLAHALDQWPYPTNADADIGRLNFDTGIVMLDVVKARMILGID